MSKHHYKNAKVQLEVEVSAKPDDKPKVTVIAVAPGTKQAEIDQATKMAIAIATAPN